MICYQICPTSPEAHLFTVKIEISEPDPKGQKLALPAWIPGSYMIRDFAKNIVTLAATCNGARIQTKKLDKQTWQCAPCAGALRLEYQVYAWDLSVRSAHLDSTHGYFNGTSVFLRVVGKEKEPCRVEISPPEGKRYQSWRVATTLPSAGAAYLGFGLYQAEDYAALIDHPVEMGRFSLESFEVAGVPHDIAITGRHRADLERLCRDLKTICEHHVSFFGELPAMDRYLFQVMAVGEGYGGLEHGSSCSLLCKRDDLPLQGEEKMMDGYRRFLGLCSHEYFHLWNVKRIQPKRLKHADLSRETHTELLWAFEGITSYYDELALVRSGVIDTKSYLELLARTITRVMRGSGRLKQSVAESSFDAWTKFYKQDENAPNAIVSYYAKGALVALALDIGIRRETGGGKTLDDVMRGLWAEYGRTGTGVPEDGVERLAGRITGLDLGGFFDQALRGTGDLPLEELLRWVGIGFRLRPARGPGDKGGVRKTRDEKDEPPKPVLGARLAEDAQTARLSTVLDGGAAQRAGLAAGDIIVAVDGIRATPANLERLIARLPAEETVPVHAFRRDELMLFELTPQLAPADTCELWVLDEADENQRRRRESWLQIGSSNAQLAGGK